PLHQGRLLVEDWLRCSEGDSRVCAERLRRLANGRASWGWPEACFLARDVADALLTGAMKLLPGGSPRGSTGAPCSPPILVVHTRLINHERCPPALYARGLSYLVQTLAEGGRRAGAPARPGRGGGGGPAAAGAGAADVAALADFSAGFGFGDRDVEDSEDGASYGPGGGGGGGAGGASGRSPISSSSAGGPGPAEVVLVIDAHKDTVGAKVKKIISLLIGEGGAGGGGGGGDDRGSGGARRGRDVSR
ncbi:unnamed protein product, partial [Hapterophycus canaliculatus]